MVMDYVRSLYYSRMRLYRDRPDLLTRGRWHWCPPGATALPFAHVYGSFTLDPYWFDGDAVTVGEVPGKQGIVRAPENPRYLGQNYCGSIETWQHGALYSQRGTPVVDDEGVPICCVSGPPIPGGGECGGEAIWPGEGVSAGVRLGASVEELSEDVVAGVRLGASVSDPGYLDVVAGVRLGASVTEPPSEVAGVRLGGEVDDLVGEDVVAGVRLGASVSDPGYLDVVAGVRLGGEVDDLVGEDVVAGVRLGASVSEGVQPGSTCLTAGVGTLGALVDQTGRPNGEDWYSFPATAGGSYHFDADIEVGKMSIAIYYGTCAGLTQIAFIGSDGCTDLSGVPAGTTLYVKVLIAFLFGTNYSFTMDSGTC